MTLDELASEGCRNGAPRLAATDLPALLAVLPGWTVADETIGKRFRFADFAGALAFANRVGEVAEAANHHPDVELGWGYCGVRFTTHDAGGLTRNDLICAAQVERLAPR